MYNSNMVISPMFVIKKANKEISKIVKLEFEQSSLALNQVREIQSKLKYH